MINLEKEGESTFITLRGATVNSLKNSVAAELIWSFIEMRERRNWLRTQYDGMVREIRAMFNMKRDLDLGIFYELNNGRKGLIDPIQFKGRGGPVDKRTPQGCFRSEPYIWHEGDQGGLEGEFAEHIYINTPVFQSLKRAFIYAFIWRGAPHWEKTDADVVIKVGGQNCVNVKLGQTEDPHKFCVVAEIIPHGDQIEIKRLSTFHKNHSECDKAYGWGFKWTSGTK
ncbi:MAG: stress protein [Muribaculaceae bacterium]|nr:stress protein [Muribaculaceae bacterium]